jgi:hypothetical protein
MPQSRRERREPERRDGAIGRLVSIDLAGELDDAGVMSQICLTVQVLGVTFPVLVTITDPQDAEDIAAAILVARKRIWP